MDFTTELIRTIEYSKEVGQVNDSKIEYTVDSYSRMATFNLGSSIQVQIEYDEYNEVCWAVYLSNDDCETFYNMVEAFNFACDNW